MQEIIKTQFMEAHYLNGLLHREDGPALIRYGKYQCWYLNGQLHRENGPAVEHSNCLIYCQNGKNHREDGPAVIHPNGKNEYWTNGNKSI